MSERGSSFGREWTYRFVRPDGSIVETGTFDGDDTAEAYARRLSESHTVPLKVERKSVVDWDYVTEVDERP